jgi:hypothetical protein
MDLAVWAPQAPHVYSYALGAYWCIEYPSGIRERLDWSNHDHAGKMRRLHETGTMHPCKLIPHTAPLPDGPKVECRYCGQSNWANQLGCRGCGAPLPIILSEESYAKEEVRPFSPSGTYAFLVKQADERSDIHAYYQTLIQDAGLRVQQDTRPDGRGVHHSVGKPRLERR